MKKIRFLSTLIIFAITTVVSLSPALAAQEPLTLQLRTRQSAPYAPDHLRIVQERQEWKPGETAVIVCDMWNKHWCKGATERVGQLAPAMNEVLRGLRARGVTIIHAPSETLKSYADHPARKHAQATPKAANLPEGIGQWCRWMNDAEEKAGYPIDDSDGGCDCQPTCEQEQPWTKQIETIQIHNEDYISDSGAEIWSILEEDGIQNILLMGVHTNMCVSGRPFGLRNLKRNGKNVALVRDLTDTMYNSRQAPNVSHFTGTDLYIEHVETYIAPTVDSTMLGRTTLFRFPADKRPVVTLILAEREYHSEQTMAEFARFLQKKYDLSCRFALGKAQEDGPTRNDIPGLEYLAGDTDLAIVFSRRRALPAEQMKGLRDYLDKGGALLGIRTASHAFDAQGKGPKGHQEWIGFDKEILGCNYNGHYGHLPEGTDVTPVAGVITHPILQGVGAFNSPSWLYKMRPLEEGATALMMGKVAGEEPEPVVIITEHRGGRIVSTTLGHWDDFDIPAFRRLLVNSIFWAIDKPIPNTGR